MVRSLAFFFAILFVHSVVAQQQDGMFSIDRYRAGPVTIGADAYDLYELFPREGRQLIDRQLEATLSPALALTVPGARIAGGLIAELAPVDSKLVVFRIAISDPIFRTDKGIGVDSTVGELRAAYDLDEISTAEGAVYITVNELAASFALDQSGPSGTDLWRIKDPRDVPDDVKIAIILLTE